MVKCVYIKMEIIRIISGQPLITVNYSNYYYHHYEFIRTRKETLLRAVVGLLCRGSVKTCNGCVSCGSGYRLGWATMRVYNFCRVTLAPEVDDGSRYVAPFKFIRRATFITVVAASSVSFVHLYTLLGDRNVYLQQSNCTEKKVLFM